MRCCYQTPGALSYRKLSKGDISEMESYLSVGLDHKTIPHYYGCYKSFSTLLCSSPHLPQPQPAPPPSLLNMVHTECLGAKDISEAPFDSSSIHSIWVDYQEMLTLSKVSTCISNVESALHTVYMTYWHRWRWRWEPVTGSLGKAFTVLHSSLCLTSWGDWINRQYIVSAGSIEV